MRKRLIQEVAEGKNLEVNLPEMFAEMASVNTGFAGTSFAMHYFSFHEAVADGDIVLEEEPKQIWKLIGEIVERTVMNGVDPAVREGAVRALDDIRAKITERMQVLTSFVDHFRIYEYMLNRIEPNFEELTTLPDDDTIAREILQYIFMEKDNVVVNARIHEMLSQLPVRIARGKFFELVKAGVENYLGMDVSAMEDFAYRIESSAGIYSPKGFEETFPEIFEAYSEFGKAEWNFVSEEEYRRLESLLKKTTDRLSALTEQYYSLMEIVNNLYAWLLNAPYASAEALAMTGGFAAMFGEIAAQAKAEQKMSIAEKYENVFAETEGSLENYSVQIPKLQGVLEELGEKARKAVPAMMLETQLLCLERSSLLLKESLFMELEKADEKPVKAERADLDQMQARLEQELKEALENQPKLKNRAMIAAVFSELPVFFNSHNEVMDYVRSSLAGCHELAEKTACVRLMKVLMEG